MKNLTVIGVDLAKNYIQIHGADGRGKCVLKRRVKREQFIVFMANLPKCLVGMEACGGSNYWAKQLIELGFDAKIMSPQKVKKYTSHNKNDYRDAEACAEAVTRASMTFVSLKTDVQMEVQAIHRIRSHYVKERTALMNMIRGLALDRGIAIAKGDAALKRHFLQLKESNLLSEATKALFNQLENDLLTLNEKVDGYTAQIMQLSKRDEHCQRLETIDGMGPITSTALIAKIGNGSEFKNGRELSAYLGLTPRQASSGDKQVLLGITKHGDRYLRQLLIHGGRSAVNAAMRKDKKTDAFVKQDKHSAWIRALATRIGINKTSVAVANKNARMVIALLKNQKNFDAALAH